MAVTVVLGSQWGDEGKGKIVDRLGRDAEIVARYQGGANAGHTIAWGDETHVLHLIPSGIFSEGVTCVIGNGVVIDPVALGREIDSVEALGYRVKGRLHISTGAHLIMPYHMALEAARERVRGSDAIGTTGRGIGPAYMHKAARSGIRVADFLGRDEWQPKVRAALRETNAILQHVYHQPALDARVVIAQCEEAAAKIVRYAANTTDLLARALAEGRHVLAEGAQGALLDIDFGTYPYVTSSNPTVGGACTGLGIPPGAINRVIGVTKAYCTRVGNGPFPTELEDAAGRRLREVGVEFGATTGRPRRCGWLDLVALRYAVQINGFTELALTKLDVLSGLDVVRVCTGYRIGGRHVGVMPQDVRQLYAAAPVYDTLPGWLRDIRGVRAYAALPEPARRLVEYIAKGTGVPIRTVSTGPRRDETISVDIRP